MQQYINGATQEIPQSMILQMMGRSGRQQYDTSGRVYIMTKQDKVVSIVKKVKQSEFKIFR